MHIPTSMLNGAICPVTAAVSVLGLGVAATVAKKNENKPSAAKFAAVTALMFALQMLNYPVQNGTSGHLVGALLGVSLLGIPFAILSTAVVLAVQAVFFGDGGINALGANILNMSLLGAGLGGVVYSALKAKKINKHVSLGIAAFFSVLIGAFACSLEVGISGAVTFNKVLPAMLSVHALIGLGESLLTVAVVSVLSFYAALWQEKEPQFALGSFMLAGVAVTLSPFASGFPDGLEWVAQKLSFLEFGGFEISAMFPDYQAGFITNAAAATIFAGWAGIALVYGLTWVIGKSLEQSKIKISA
ncbi:MAG: energy-coupling factor ABC transporter permease [Candidatus Omnitrophica bacterium]|nr:energy-coupling factor ABC transporter permease [Candidatus Omnitrophota bacterium]